MNTRRRASGFTLIELLATVAVVGLLAAITVPAWLRAKGSVKRIQCVNHLRQLGLAAQLYWDDHQQRSFAYLGARSRGGVVYWFGWLGGGREGQREVDHSQGVLWPYLKGRGVELCPSFDYHDPRYKPKAKGASYGYGYNLHLASGGRGQPAEASSFLITRLLKPSGTILFADAAQVNDFQPPASKAHPLFEEFYYVNHSTGDYPNVHFRHEGHANGVFCDGHVHPERPVPGSLDRRLPELRIGRLRPGILLVP